MMEGIVSQLVTFRAVSPGRSVLICKLWITPHLLHGVLLKIK